MFDFKDKSFKENKIAFGWLILSIVAIAISGIFSIFLVFLRTPGLVGLFSKNIFKFALIIHVNLSITIWMLTILCFLNSLVFTAIRKKLSLWLLIISIIGTLLISISPLFGGEPMLNNYIPILDNLIFILGLSLFLCGVIASTLFAVIEFCINKNNETLNIVSFTSSLIFLIGFLCFYLTVSQIKNANFSYDLGHYYETIFWGFGHVIQFVFIQLVLYAWFVLAESHLTTIKLSKEICNKILYLNPLFCVICPFFFLYGSIESGEYIDFFTKHMKYFGGVSAVIAVIVVITYLLREKTKQLDYKIYSCLFSILVFGMGGVIGCLIIGSNVTVPAHYHGSIVGITIALMGFVYYIIEQLGFKFSSSIIINYQLLLYCLGQTMHITGLALSGGYGAMRKVAGVELSHTAKFYMGLMGLGGIIAIISGIIFVLNCYFAITNGRKNEPR